eukprot:TRINITY_DN986_c0_g1_i10.p1 TRINITY_DN986_c0_g1~~TRINITY_DN986_c0_g1_i10.p1  ORF type:complete len:484 (-),score=78.38 TRINITY_DN986_c0_g1_i10:77-1528(-)
MKQSRYLPIHQWYDHHGDSRFDYPLLSGYLHYIGSFIYTYVDPYSLDAISLDDIKGIGKPLVITPEIKLAMRVTVYIITIPTLYPTVVFVAMRLIDARKPLMRLVIISLLLNAPLLILIDFTLFQFNCTSYCFFFLAYLYAYEKEFVKSTVSTCLCLLTKHMSAPMVFPIGFFALGYAYKKAKDTSTGGRVKAVVWMIVKLSFVAFVTCFIVLWPLIKEGAFGYMIRNMTTVARRGLSCDAINFWSFIDFLVAPYDIPEYHSTLLKICSLLVLINSLIVGIFLLKRPTRDGFATAFTLTHLGLFVFGYYMHEKHIVYAYFGLVLSYQFNRDILPLICQLSNFGTFLMIACNADSPVQIFLLIFATWQTVVCKDLVDKDPDFQITYKVKSSNLARSLKDWLEAINGICPRLMNWFSVYLAVFFAVNLWNEISLLWFIDTFRKLAMQKAPFFIVGMLYAQQWILLYLQSSEDVRIIRFPKSVKSQ